GDIHLVRVFPAFTDELLYVSRAGSVTQPPDKYTLKVAPEDNSSLSMDSETEDFDDTPDIDSQFARTYSESDLRANSWTSRVTDQDVHQQSYFFALPKGVSPNDEIDPSEFKFKYFLLCKNRREEHDSSPHFAGVSGVDIIRPAEFLERYSAMVLWSLQSLRSELQNLSDRLGDGTEEYARITSLLQSEVDLPSADQVEPLVDKMIGYIQELQIQKSMDWTPESEDAVDRPRLSRNDVTILPSYLDSPLGMQHNDMASLGLIRNCDPRGHEQWVGYVTEFTVNMNWDATTEDLQSIHALAKKLGFSNLTVTSITTAQSDSTVIPSSQPPLLHKTPGHHFPLTNIEEISRFLARGMKNLNIVTYESLDASKFFHRLFIYPVSKDGLGITIKAPSLMCTADYCDSTFQLLELEASFSDCQKICSMIPFNSHLQYLTITNTDPVLTEDALLSKAYEIKMILYDNPDLPSLNLHCSANEFHRAEAMMKSINDELSVGPAPCSRLSSYTLIDNTEDHLFATFNLSSNRVTNSIVANVTVRDHGTNLSKFLSKFGPFIRNLNANDKFGPGTIKALYDSIALMGSSQLMNVMISLRTLDMESARNLLYVLFLSKTSLQQVVLVGSPPDNNIGAAVVDTLESLEVKEVVLFNDEHNMETWITQVQESLPISSILTVLDRVEDLRRIVPGHDDTSLDWLKDRQAAHLSSAVSQGSSKGSPATKTLIQSERRIKPSAEYKAFRVLGQEQSTVKLVPITDDDYGQVVLEKHIASMYGAFDHVESNGRLVPFLTDSLYPDQYRCSPETPTSPKSRMILADRDGDPANRNEFYEVSFTPYTGNSTTSDQGNQ
ncbi:hypothetical protein BGZ97_007848, partial [Linnemannia gamsii]